LNLLRSYFGSEHYFYNDFKKSGGGWRKVISEGVKQPIYYSQEDMANYFAVLLHIKSEFEAGLVTDARSLYESDLFSNLLEQAVELAEKNYLVGAAVYGRLVIETFINDLCRIKNVELQESDRLPQKLGKLRQKEAFDLPMDRLIQSKYDIGSYAVHGNEEFKKYSKEDVLDLLRTIKEKILIIK
jgi:hypothetical protein